MARIAAVLLAGLLAPAAPADVPGASPARAGAPAVLHRDPLRLRGYGELSADFRTVAVPGGGDYSALAISCEDAAKAGVVHAKFVGDLHLLGTLTDATWDLGGREVAVASVPRQGCVCAFRNGSVVHILARPSEAGLRAGLASAQGHLAGAELTPRSKVPMFLDAWDRHAFRFYYWPFQIPPGTEWRDHDLRAEFDFARRNNQSGVVLWSGDERCDFADGLTNEPFWNWAARAAERRNLPVVVNTQLTDNASWLLNRFRDQTQQRMPGYCGGYYTAGDASHAGLGHLSWSATTALDNWLVPEERATRRAVFRRPLAVPDGWAGGPIHLGLTNWTHNGVRGRLRAWLDGAPIAEGSAITACDLTAQLVPGRLHQLTIEIDCEGPVAGFIGNAWLAYQPAPHDRIAPRHLPRPDQRAGRPAPPSRGRHRDPPQYVTPWIRFGEDNEIHIVRGTPGEAVITRVALEFFDPESSP